jgi:hypothetical protein
MRRLRLIIEVIGQSLEVGSPFIIVIMGGPGIIVILGGIELELELRKYDCRAVFTNGHE